jgi:ABC-type multidrug transport system permease subunit
MHSATGYLDLSFNWLIVDWIVLVVVCAIILFIGLKKNRWKDV